MPAITFSSDIGLNDYLVGAIKGQLITAVPQCPIADISHQLSSNYQQAAYVCGNAFKYYPEGTFHLVLINFFERPPKHLLLAPHNKQFIICPDNGILTMIAGAKPSNIFAIDTLNNGHSSLLDCTRIIASTISQLLAGETLTSLATPIENIDEKYPMRSAIGSDWIDSQIIYIDNFENVVLNITKDEFEEIRQQRRFRIVLMRNSEVITKLSHHYASVQAGENLAFFNSAGYLEIAINKGNVAGLFGLQRYAESNANIQNRLLYQTVRIVFE